MLPYFKDKTRQQVFNFVLNQACSRAESILRALKKEEAIIKYVK